MTTSSTTRAESQDDRRANPLGAYVATLGAIILLVSVWLNWVTLGRGDETSNASSGYEADSLIPWLGFLAISFAIALLYATVRADRRQHRGLSLASMAAGLATLLFTIAFVIDPIATRQYSPDNNISTEFGVYVAMLGALLWALGSFMLATQPEGDIERNTTIVRETQARPVQTTEHVTHVGTTHVGTTHGTTTHGTTTHGSDVHRVDEGYTTGGATGVPTTRPDTRGATADDDRL